MSMRGSAGRAAQGPALVPDAWAILAIRFICTPALKGPVWP